MNSAQNSTLRSLRRNYYKSLTREARFNTMHPHPKWFLVRLRRALVFDHNGGITVQIILIRETL